MLTVSLDKLRQWGCPEDLIPLIVELDSPEKTQSFLNGLSYNFVGEDDEEPETAKSVVRVFRTRTAHCFEGAMFGYTMLKIHNYPTWLLLLHAINDFDHNVALYIENGRYGAVAQSRHDTLKKRDPVYKSIRELVLSYWPYYTSDWEGYEDQTSLFGFSEPLDLVGRFGEEYFFTRAFSDDEYAWNEIYDLYTRGLFCTRLIPKPGESDRYVYPYPSEFNTNFLLSPPLHKSVHQF